MIDWLWNNRTWLFSGGAISAMAIISWIVRRAILPASVPDSNIARIDNSSISQSPTINQSSVINITNSLVQPPLANIDDLVKGQSSESAMQTEVGGRPDLFPLPPGVEDISAESFRGAAAQFGRSHITTYLARFKLAANDRSGIGRELTASIEYIDRLHPTRRDFPQERLAMRVGEAFWRGAIGGSQVIEEGKVIELAVGAIVDGRLWAFREFRGEQYPGGIMYRALEITASSEPYAQVTLVDVHFGWRWRIQYRMHMFPIDLRQKGRLVPLLR